MNADTTHNEITAHTARITELYELARGGWSGRHWPLPQEEELAGGRDDYGVALTADDRQRLAGEVRDYDAGCVRDAREAEAEATEAVRYLRTGEYADAWEHAKRAAALERQYGDTPTWGDFADAVEALNDLVGDVL